MTVKVHSGLCMKYSRWDILYVSIFVCCTSKNSVLLRIRRSLFVTSYTIFVCSSAFENGCEPLVRIAFSAAVHCYPRDISSLRYIVTSTCSFRAQVNDILIFHAPFSKCVSFTVQGY